MTTFGEPVVPGFSLQHEGEHLVSERSAFQQIDVYETPSFGRVLALDGLLQTSERDEWTYHEMLVHVPLLTLAAPRRVLVIGGGDGGTLRHVLMHPSVEQGVMVEIDERVTAVCREWLPAIAGDAFDDPRAHVLFADGLAYVRDGDDRFDAILIDSSDPVGPGEGLFTADFYRNAARRLTEGGVIVAQTGSPFVQQGELHRAHRNMSSVFPDVRVYLGHVPTYPSTIWSYTMAGERLDLDEASAAARAAERGIVARYWTPQLQTGAFRLNQVVLDVIAPDGPPYTWGLSPEEATRVPGS